MAPRDVSVCVGGLPLTEALLLQFRQADSRATRDAVCEQIVELTLGLADAAARSFRNKGMDPEDLTQVARLGLMKAIYGYDPASGGRFAAYALPTITGEIKRYFRDQGWFVRPPRRLQEMHHRVTAEEEALRGRLRRQPTSRELADHLGVELSTVAESRVAARAFAVEPLSATDGLRPVEPVAAGDPFTEVVEWESVRDALHLLSRRERHILRLRFVDELTQSQIAVRVGVSQMQVSRILGRCLRRLRDHVEAEPAAQAPVVTHRRRHAFEPEALAG